VRATSAEATFLADGARISTKGWGANQSVADNQTEESRSLNRRDEIAAKPR